MRWCNGRNTDLCCVFFFVLLLLQARCFINSVRARLGVTQRIEISLEEIIQPLSCGVGAFMNGSRVEICISEYRIQNDPNSKLSGILIEMQTG